MWIAEYKFSNVFHLEKNRQMYRIVITHTVGKMVKKNEDLEAILCFVRSMSLVIIRYD